MPAPATPPTRPIGFWLKLVDRLLEARLDAALAADRVTRRHWQVMNVLAQAPRSAADVDRAVAPFLGASAPSATPLLADLIDRGWAARDQATCRLTPQGLEALASLRTAVERERERSMRGITADEYRQVIDVLGRVALNLGWTEAQG